MCTCFSELSRFDSGCGGERISESGFFAIADDVGKRKSAVRRIRVTQRNGEVFMAAMMVMMRMVVVVVVMTLMSNWCSCSCCCCCLLRVARVHRRKFCCLLRVGKVHRRKCLQQISCRSIECSYALTVCLQAWVWSKI